MLEVFTGKLFNFTFKNVYVYLKDLSLQLTNALQGVVYKLKRKSRLLPKLMNAKYSISQYDGNIYNNKKMLLYIWFSFCISFYETEIFTTCAIFFRSQ